MSDFRPDDLISLMYLARDDEHIVVAGKGHETDQIIGTEGRQVDDREELRKGRRL